jgi:hypothetical protein
MAAGQGFKTFATGDVLTAADTNGYLMQGVWVFADATARDAAVTSPQEGNMCYLKSTDAVQYYSGSAWTAIGGGATILKTRKASDQTVVSSTTLANDSDLFFAIAANEVFTFQVYLSTYSAASTGGLKASFTGPAGSTVQYGGPNAIYLANGSVTAGIWSTGGLATDYLVDANNRSLLFSGTISNGATAGNLRFQWAQNTSTATGVTVKAGSSIVGIKV